MTVFAKNSLPAETELTALRDAVDHRLNQLLPLATQHDRIGAAMRAATLTSGKRIRPLLLLLVAGDLGCDSRLTGVMDLACALEMIHAASLILDDIPCMDNAQLRRGQPTIHRQFGQDVAILAAVALLSSAFGLVASAHGLSESCRAQAVAALSMAVGPQGLVQGQFEDLNEGKHRRSTQAITRTNDLKTSMLFDAALQMAALAAGASAVVRDKLHCVAHELGQAFQLLDDLTDSHPHTGKDSNKDVGKSTLVALLGTDRVRQRLYAHLQRADHHFSSLAHPGLAARRFIHGWFKPYLDALV